MRFGRRFPFVLAVFAGGCGGGPPEDPFSDGPHFDLASTARALAGLTANVETAPLAGDVTPLLALARETNDDVQVIGADGGGALFEEDPLSAGEGPRHVVAADVNGDGSPDLLSLATGGSELRLFLQTAEGAFSPGATSDMPAPPLHAVALDADGDGLSDVAVAMGLGDAGQVALWRGATGTLDVGGPLLLPGVSRLATGDLDGDGRPDVAGLARENVALFRNSQSSLTRGGEIAAPCSGPLSVAIGDLDRDGRGDLILGCEGEAVVVLDPLGAAVAHSLGPVSGRLNDVVALDLNADGNIDVAATDVAAHETAIWLSAAQIAGESPVLHAAPKGPVAIVAVDLDRDGDPDLAVLGFEARKVGILRNGPAP